ncbi:MAG: M81 family metallopeptidase [Armatimonadetes bacterium]|nr:M81 family metallopeptidase [Armatimonadota bacterium]
MRVAVGGIFHESNTFFTRPTTFEEFTRRNTTRGPAILQRWQGTVSEIGGYIEEAHRQKVFLVPTLMVHGMPSGPISDIAFEQLVGELLERIAGVRGLEAVLLSFHGAMVTETLQDADGEVLRRVRDLVGPEVPIAATLDFHANTSPLMVAQADILVGGDTNPHLDYRERGRECVALLARGLRGEIAPRMALAKAPLMPNILRQRTAEGPMAALMERAHAAEAEPGMLAVSVAAGFAYADVECAGLSCVAMADGDLDRARAVADAIADRAWELRESFDAHPPRAKEAVALAIASGSGPIVLVDVGDNVGGGTPGDGTTLLSELLEQDARGALVVIADPGAVARAVAAGVRNDISLDVGGKTDEHHGPPVRVHGRVRLISDGMYTNRGPLRHGIAEDMGRTVVLHSRGLTIVLTEYKTPMWDLQQLRSLGIEPALQRIIAVKAAIAYRAAYEPIAAQLIEVDTPGLTAADVRRYSYRNVPRPIWPLDR